LRYKIMKLANDMGFELADAYRSGWLVLIATGVLTAAAWIIGYSALGGGS